jgi:hypothetical protein
MSQRDHTRTCPGCERELCGREHFGEGGLTVIWKCVCGWGSARTVPTAMPGDPRAQAYGGDGSSPARPRATFDDLRIRKSSGVRARPVPEARTENDERDSVEATKARKSDG